MCAGVELNEHQAEAEEIPSETKATAYYANDGATQSRLSHHLHDGRTHQPVWADRKAWTV